MVALPGEGTDFRVEVYPDRPAWLAARMTGIGSSDAPAVWSAHRFASPMSLWAQKRGLAPDDEEQADEATIEGQLIEPVIAELYRRQVGHALVDLGRFTLLRSLHWPWMFASPDRLLPDTPQGPGGLECKRRQALAARVWDGGPPLDVQWQAQHCMAVTGWEWWDAAMLPRVGRLRRVRIERMSDEDMGEHVERCRELWEQVQTGESPQADGHEATGRTLRRLHPGESGDTINLGPEADEAVETWCAGKAAAKAGRGKADMGENLLRQMLGAATWGVLPSGRKVRLAKERKNADRILRLYND